MQSVLGKATRSVVMAWETHIAPQSQGTRMWTDVGSTDRLGENPKRQPEWNSTLKTAVGQG